MGVRKRDKNSWLVKGVRTFFIWEIETPRGQGPRLVLPHRDFLLPVYSRRRRPPRPRGTTSGIRFKVLGALPLYLSFPIGLLRLTGVADPLRRELLQFRRPRISTVSCPAPSTTPLTVPLRSSPGLSSLLLFRRGGKHLVAVRGFRRHLRYPFGLDQCCSGLSV